MGENDREGVKDNEREGVCVRERELEISRMCDCKTKEVVRGLEYSNWK